MCLSKFESQVRHKRPYNFPPKRPIALKSISKFSSIAQMNFQPDLKHSLVKSHQRLAQDETYDS